MTAADLRGDARRHRLDVLRRRLLVVHLTGAAEQSPALGAETPPPRTPRQRTAR